MSVGLRTGPGLVGDSTLKLPLRDLPWPPPDCGALPRDEPKTECENECEWPLGM